MHDPGTTWLDWIIWSYFGFGWVLMCVGMFVSDWTASYALMVLGGIAAAQAMLFLMIRSLLRRSVRSQIQVGSVFDQET